MLSTIVGGVPGSRWHLPRAEAATALVEWDAPEACPDTRVLFEKLSGLLGHEPTTLGHISRVRGVVEHAAEGYRLTLEVVEPGRRSSRLFVAPDCADLISAAALAIALAVHGETAAGSPSGESPLASAAEGAAVPEGRDAAAASGEPAQVAAPELHWSGGAEAVLDFGAFPAPAPGIAGELRAAWGPWAFGAHAVFLPQQRFAVGNEQFIDFWLAAGGVRACHSLVEDARLGVGVCASLEAGVLDAAGDNLGSARDVATPWLAPGVALEARTQLADAVQLRVRAEPLLPLSRKQYAINGTEAVHAASAIELRLYLGLVLGAP